MDYRDVLTFTIDPTDAKDFDDALSFQEKKNGDFEVGIHIADVSHYVKEGSVLDNEAYQRATSVYLVDRVVPMLPEQLSNKVCSLRPNEDKLTFAAIFTLDTEGNIKNQKFGRTVINSNYRFAYHEAQYIIDTKEIAPFCIRFSRKCFAVVFSWRMASFIFLSTVYAFDVRDNSAGIVATFVSMIYWA